VDSQTQQLSIKFNIKNSNVSSQFPTEVTKLVEWHVTTNEGVVNRPHILDVLAKQDEQVGVVPDGLLWNPEVVLGEVATVCPAVPPLAEVILSRGLLLKHDIVEDHDAVLVHIQLLYRHNLI